MSTQRTHVLTIAVVIAVLAAGPVAGIDLNQPANTWVKRSRRPVSKDTARILSRETEIQPRISRYSNK